MANKGKNIMIANTTNITVNKVIVDQTTVSAVGPTEVMAIASEVVLSSGFEFFSLCLFRIGSISEKKSQSNLSQTDVR